MTAEVWLSLGALAVSASLAVNNWINARHDRRRGVAGVEQVQRRDTVTDRDALIDQLQEEITRLRSRVDALEVALDIEQRHNRALVDQIYRGDPPPPVARTA